MVAWSAPMTADALREALRREVAAWSAKPYDALVAELPEVAAYEAKLDGEDYQVEVQLIEHTPGYLHVMVAVDDGGWRAWKPLTGSFLVYRTAGTGSSASS